MNDAANDSWNELDLDRIPADVQDGIVAELIDEIYLGRFAKRSFPERFYFPFNPSHTTWHNIYRFLNIAISEKRVARLRSIL